MLKLCERLKAARGYARLFQKDFAARIGKSIPSIAAYESGETAPSVDDLKAAAELFNVSAAWLILGEGQMEISMATLPTERSTHAPVR